VGVGEIIDGADAFDLFLRHGAKNVTPDAAEAINAVICDKEKRFELCFATAAQQAPLQLNRTKSRGNDESEWRTSRNVEVLFR
jgi:hypothetical protein